MIIDAKDLHFQKLNRQVKECNEDLTINNCIGQRFIAAGKTNGTITINGTPGNALGAYLDGAKIIVNGSGQDAVGDTMNDGSIVISGDAGDALGYAMRGGKLYVKGNSGYRTGIHMKEYKDKKPFIIVGGTAGSFLGEYLAGGVIVVLNLKDYKNIIGDFAGTGMHGGKIFLRCDKEPVGLPQQVSVARASKEDLLEIKNELTEYCDAFSLDYDSIANSNFYILSPNAKNPYKRLYVTN